LLTGLQNRAEAAICQYPKAHLLAPVISNSSTNVCINDELAERKPENEVPMRNAAAAPNAYFVVQSTWRADWEWGLPLIVLTVVIHVLGLEFLNQKAVEVLSRQEGVHGRSRVRFALVISTWVLLATCLHVLEAGAWAACYLFLGARSDFTSAMLYSMGAMTTFGSSLVLEGEWRLMGQIEALSGWLLFGLTAAFLFSTIHKSHQDRDRR
jgi:hypothetical protein